MTFDMITMIGIRLIACEKALAKDPDQAPAHVIDDEILRASITEYFSTEEEWDPTLLEPALATYKHTEELENKVQLLAGSFLGAVMSGGYNGR